MEARIVVVDNDDGIRDLLTMCLSDASWQVFNCAYAHIDLATLQQYHPDLIILDFNIRNIGMAWEFLQGIKMEDATAGIPILITTTLAEFSAELQSYLLTRHINIIYKPFALDSFLLLVERTLTLASQAGTIVSSDRILPILVVEDTEDLRDILTTVLRFEGYQVVTAENGLLALNAIHSIEYCLILLDIAMPIMDGFEFLTAYDRQLRPHIPVVILSGEEDILTKLLPSFVIDVLPKPFEINRLLSVVKKFAQPA